MGRHSAPDDTPDVGPADAGVVVVDEDAAAGRHAEGVVDAPVAVEAVAAAETIRIPVLADPEVDQPIPEADTVLIPAVGAPVVDDPVPVDAPPVDARPVDAPPAAAPTDAAPTDASPTDAAAAAPPAPEPARESRSSAGDVALVRAHRDVLARCVAAVVVPIAIYLVVLAVVGSLRWSTVLIWCAIPLVVAGVLVGFFLDAGHRRYPSSSGSPDRP